MCMDARTRMTFCLSVRPPLPGPHGGSREPRSHDPPGPAPAGVRRGRLHPLQPGRLRGVCSQGAGRAEGGLRPMGSSPLTAGSRPPTAYLVTAYLVTAYLVTLFISIVLFEIFVEYC